MSDVASTDTSSGKTPEELIRTMTSELQAINEKIDKIVAKIKQLVDDLSTSKITKTEALNDLKKIIDEHKKLLEVDNYNNPESNDTKNALIEAYGPTSGGRRRRKKRHSRRRNRRKSNRRRTYRK